MRNFGLCMLFASFAASSALADPISISIGADSGQLLSEPAVLVTNHPVAEFNIRVPIVGCAYANVSDSQRWDENSLFSGPGDELDLTLGCGFPIGPKYDFDANGSLYDIAGSHNNRLVAKAALTRHFDGWDGWIGVEGQRPMNAPDVAILHIGASHHFNALGLAWTHSPEVSVFNYGPSTFSDTLSAKISTAGLVWSPHIIASVPTYGKTFFVFGVSADL